MRNLHALLRSNGFKFVFGIVYRLGNLMRLKRLKLKTHYLRRRWGIKYENEKKLVGTKLQKKSQIVVDIYFF